MHSFTAIDLFCGCGGLSLGLKKAGFRILGSVDIDPFSIETYKVNHPEVMVFEKDIRDLSTNLVKKKLDIKKGDLDLIAGCPPCQGFSSIRTLNGSRDINDSRNNLIFEFLRFVEKLNPKVVMMENVPGLEKDDCFREFLEKIKIIGFEGDWHIFNAADFGVPQRRRRLLYIGSRKKTINFTSQLNKRLTVRDAIETLPFPGESGDPLHDLTEKRSTRIRNLIKKIPKDGGGRNDLPHYEQLKCHKACDGFKDIYGRMSWDDVAPTITSGCINPSKGRFLHPEQDRAITLREAALLQTFPNNYYFSLEKGKFRVANLIGNALPPEFVMHHAQAIRKSLESKN